MPQDSIYYAIGRLSVMQKNNLDKNRLERLLQAPSVREARRTLSEFGWSDSEDYDKLSSDHLEEACKLVRKLTTDETSVNCFLLRYDVNNLKMLIKARCQGVEAESLSPCGIYPVDMLYHQVTEHKYQKLPQPLLTALNALEKRLALEVDPLDIDATLDKALFETVFDWLPKGNTALRRYFRARADIVNLTMALRVLHMGKPFSFLSGLLLPGGKVSAKEWKKAFDQPEKLALTVHDYGNEVYRAAIAAQLDYSRTAALEKALDDHLLSLYAPYRHEMDKPERLCAYLLLKERESAAVRLIMAGKNAGFGAEKIRERLRDVYGR